MCNLKVGNKLSTNAKQVASKFEPSSIAFDFNKSCKLQFSFHFTDFQFLGQQLQIKSKYVLLHVLNFYNQG
jgi:hypothetical protein